MQDQLRSIQRKDAGAVVVRGGDITTANVLCQTMMVNLADLHKVPRQTIRGEDTQILQILKHIGPNPIVTNPIVTSTQVVEASTGLSMSDDTTSAEQKASDSSISIPPPYHRMKSTLSADVPSRFLLMELRWRTQTPMLEQRTNLLMSRPS